MGVAAYARSFSKPFYSLKTKLIFERVTLRENDKKSKILVKYSPQTFSKVVDRGVN